MTATSYIMESEREAQRLEAKTDRRQSIEQLKLVGLRPGMTVLDAGAGTGAVARVMAELVGAEGQVTALDLSEERLARGQQLAAEQGLTNLRFQRGDLYCPGLPADSFDLVWCRFVFEFLAEPDRALASLVRLARPGGLVVVGDLDGNGLFHDPLPDRLKADIDRLLSIVSPSFDPHAGRRLFHRFVRAGLKNIRVHCLPYHVYAGAIPEGEVGNWQTKFAAARPRVAEAFGGEEKYDEFARAFLDFLRDPETFTYSILLLVQGTRPG